jgi:transposase-like protein
MMKSTKHKAPGKAHRKGITLVQLMDMFPNEEAATDWFEETFWAGDRCCGHCGSTRTREVPNRKPMPYWCSDCRKYFSVRTGTVLQKSRVRLRKWAIALYLELTSLKGISSMKLHRDIGVSQPTAWFMLHRIREGWNQPNGNGDFSGPVEVDEAYMGGKRRNMSNKQRKQLTGRGPVGKVAVAGVKDRASNRVAAQVVPNTKSETMSRFIMEHVEPGARIYTDDALTYHALPNHETVKHSVGEYVRGKAHTNGVESFWAMLKRAYTGTFHKMSPKHLHRYVNEFAGKHNLRQLDTLDQMRLVALGLVGKHLSRAALIADTGLSSGARS